MRAFLGFGIVVFLSVSLCGADAPPFAYLLQRLKMTTDSGIHAIPAGTRVIVLEEKDGVARVQTEDGVFNVASVQLTRDKALGESLSNQDAAGQAAARMPATPMKPVEAETPPSGKGKPKPDDPRSARTKEIGRQIGILNVQIRALESQSRSVGPTINSKTSANAAANKNAKDSLKKQINALRRQIEALDREREMLRLTKD